MSLCLCACEEEREKGMDWEMGISKNQFLTIAWMLKLENGRNLTMIRLPTFGKLVRVGLPNALRGELWEVCSGSIYLRMTNQGVYEEVLKTYEGHTSLSTEEIEKDLNR